MIKFSLEDYNLMSGAWKQHTLQLLHKARLQKGKKTQKCKTKLDARVAILEAKAEDRDKKQTVAV